MNAPQNNISITLGDTPLNQNQNNQLQMYNQQNTINEPRRGPVIEEMDEEDTNHANNIKENEQSQQLLPIYNTERGIVNSFIQESKESIQNEYSNELTQISERTNPERAFLYRQQIQLLEKQSELIRYTIGQNTELFKAYAKSLGTYDESSSDEDIKEEEKKTEEEIKIKKEESNENLESNDKAPKKPKLEKDVKVIKKSKRTLTSEDKEKLSEAFSKTLVSNENITKLSNESQNQILLSTNQRQKDIDSRQNAQEQVILEAFKERERERYKFKTQAIQAYLTIQENEKYRQENLVQWQSLEQKLLEYVKPKENETLQQKNEEINRLNKQIDELKKRDNISEKEKGIMEEENENENAYLEMMDVLNQFVSKQYREYINHFNIKDLNSFANQIMNQSKSDIIGQMLVSFIGIERRYTEKQFSDIHKNAGRDIEMTKMALYRIIDAINIEYISILSIKEKSQEGMRYVSEHSIRDDFLPESFVRDKYILRQQLNREYNTQQPMQQPQMFSQQPQYTQQPYMQQFQPPVFMNPSGGFSNVNPFTSNPFMSQPQYQGYPQQQYVPQQNTTQFTNQTQYQQPSNGMQNQQPDINIQKTTMPTGSAPNMTNNSQQEFRQEYSHQKQEVPQNTSTNNTYQVPEETNSNNIYTFKTQINKADLEGNNRIATLLILYTELMDYLRTKSKSIKLKEATLIFSNSLDRQGYGKISINEFNTIHKAYMTNYK